MCAITCASSSKSRFAKFCRPGRSTAASLCCSRRRFPRSNWTCTRKVLAEVRRQHRQVLGAAHQQLQRLRYLAGLAERQFNQADPDNRLVTAELEKRWEQAMQAVKDAEQTTPPEQQQGAESLTLSPKMRKMLENVARTCHTCGRTCLRPGKRSCCGA